MRHGLDYLYCLLASRVFEDIRDDWQSISDILEFYAGNASLRDMSNGKSYWAEHNFDGEGYRTFLESAGPGHFADADMLMLGNARCPSSNYCLPHGNNASVMPKNGWPCSHGGLHTPGGWDHGNYDTCGTCMHCASFSQAEETSQLVMWWAVPPPFLSIH